MQGGEEWREEDQEEGAEGTATCSEWAMSKRRRTARARLQARHLLLPILLSSCCRNTAKCGQTART